MHTAAGSEGRREQKEKFGMQSALREERSVPVAIVSLGIAGSKLRAQ